MLIFNQDVSSMLDDWAAGWGLAPFDRWEGALAGFVLALLLCALVALAVRVRGVRRHRAQARYLRQRLLGRGRLEPG